MNYILAFVGPSGSGKTTLIMELLERLPGRTGILKSVTTRLRRGPEDDLVYDFITPAQAEQSIRQGQAATQTFYAGNYYIYQKSEVQRALSQYHACCAVVEEVILQMVAGKYPLKVIRVLPENQNFSRGEDRIAADKARSQIQVPVDLTIVNSFSTGGLEKAVNELTAFVESLK